MTNLFAWGKFTGASGRPLDWKIECEALTEEDWACIAHIAARALPPFHEVTGVPTGGFPLALALRKYRAVEAETFLVVDDVWTTGKSLLAHAAKLPASSHPWRGFVVFARGPLPANVQCLAKIEL